MKWKLVNFQVFQIILANIETDSFETRCPYPSERRLRAVSFCRKNNTSHTYSCLFDTNEQKFAEHCSHLPDYSAPGEKYVLTGNPRNVECDQKRFQPFSLWTNQSNQCIFLKSQCPEEGQVVYSYGSTIHDSACGCDYSKSYAFVTKPEHQCFCRPMFEDCSCTVKYCPVGQLLNADYICSETEDMIHSCQSIENVGIRLMNDSVAARTTINSSNFLKRERFTRIAGMATLVILFLGLTILVMSYLLLDMTKSSKWNKKEIEKKIKEKTDLPIKESGKDDIIKIVVGMDLGTTYSGYAFSSTESFNKFQLDIELNNWESGNHNNVKTPTSVLLDGNGNCKEFGYDAEIEFIDQIIDGEDNHLFFHRFKMHLYNNEALSDDWELEDINKKKMPAIVVFSAALSALTKRIKSQIKKFHYDIPEESILWILTVPAVWTNKAKDFMRRAAQKAGIQENKLQIALEPECVSVYFQHVNALKPEKFQKLTGGSISNCNYLVIDIGGGTVEITAHKSENDHIEELCEPSGCCWGSTKIDDQFIDLISSIVGKEVMKELKSKNVDSYFEILSEIEVLKSKVFLENITKCPNVNFRYPVKLDSLCNTHLGKSFAKAIEDSEHKLKIVKLKGSKIGFPKNFISIFFTDVIDKIIDEINKVLSKSTTKLDAFIVVGGLSRSPIIEDKLSVAFPSIQVIVPPDAGMAVAKGAVLYGHGHNLIISRIMPYTYGRLIQPPFEDGRHDKNKREVIDGNARCKDVFDILVEKGKSVAVGEKIIKEYKTLSKNQSKITVAVYTTQKSCVMYVDDAECEVFCEVSVDIPKPFTDKEQNIKVEFEFGNTEFSVSAYVKETHKPCNISKQVKFILR